MKRFCLGWWKCSEIDSGDICKPQKSKMDLWGKMKIYSRSVAEWKSKNLKNKCE
jgi:hypothetical protein